MITIFERETEIGKCAREMEETAIAPFADTELASVFARTVVSMDPNSGALRIEQHRYLRRDSELPAQRWIRPEFIFEPAQEKRQKNLQFAQALHEQFIGRIRNEFPQEHLA